MTDPECRLLGGDCGCVSLWACERHDPLAGEELDEPVDQAEPLPPAAPLTADEEPPF